MSNIIDIKSRLKTQNSSVLLNSKDKEDASVVDIAQIRDQMIQDDRRQVKRTILTEFVSLHTIVSGQGLLKVQLYDINDSGLSFDLEAGRGHFNIGENVEMRVYLNHQTYFQIDAKVAHVTFLSDEGLTRHGCTFVHNAMNSDALNHFVKFLESVTAGLRRDGGDVLVSKINS